MVGFISEDDLKYLELVGFEPPTDSKVLKIVMNGVAEMERQLGAMYDGQSFAEVGASLPLRQFKEITSQESGDAQDPSDTLLQLHLREICAMMGEDYYEHREETGSYFRTTPSTLIGWGSWRAVGLSIAVNIFRRARAKSANTKAIANARILLTLLTYNAVAAAYNKKPYASQAMAADEFEGDLDLSGVTSADGLQLSNNVSGSVDLSGLESADGLKLPEIVDGDLNLSNIKSAKAITLPDSVDGDLRLKKLKSAENVVFPYFLGGGIDLSGLTTAKGLHLEKYDTIYGDLEFGDWLEIDELVLPREVTGNLVLGKLRHAKRLVLPKKVGGMLVMDWLEYVEQGLVLPETVGKDIFMSVYRTMDNLTLPSSVGFNEQKIAGNFYLCGVSSLNGAKKPKITGKLYLKGDL